MLERYFLISIIQKFSKDRLNRLHRIGTCIYFISKTCEIGFAYLCIVYAIEEKFVNSLKVIFARCHLTNVTTREDQILLCFYHRIRD